MTIAIDIPKKIETILNKRTKDEHINKISVLKQMLKGESKLKLSGRGELEITDVNNYYIEKGRMGKVCWTGTGAIRGHLRVC